jgi:putative ABC transport system permease protein
MLKNYFIVALRNFWRNKTFSLINILGLAIGISASLVIFLLIHHDLTYDKFEPDSNRIFRVVAENYRPGNDEPGYQQSLPVPMASAVLKETTGADLVVPFHTWDEVKVTIPYPNAGQPKILRDQKDFAVTNASLLQLLGYTWLIGSPATALSQPYQVVLTEKNAHLYYPGMAYTDIVGKTLTFDDTVQATVSGIVKDIKDNTDFYFGSFVSRSTMETGRLKQDYWDRWNSVNSADQLFVRLSPGATAASLKPQLTRIYKKYENRKADDKSNSQLQPLDDLHFDSRYFGFDEGRTAHKPTLYGLMAVAAFLLLLACINFINLTTAQATQRAKEIGIRKTMGSRRGQLAFQFLNETFLLTVMATLLSIALTPLLLKVFSDFIPADFHINLTHQPGIIVFLLGLIVAVSLLSGCYPALVMSAFNPVSVLKNQANSRTSGTRTAWFRKSLTVSQFIIAQVFIVATLLVGKQISYALNMDMGFRKDGVIFFNTNRSDPASKKNALVTKLKTIPGIQLISVCSDPPTARGSWINSFIYNDGKKDIEAQAQVKLGDSNYFRLFDLRLLAGTPPPQSDTISAVVINEELAKTLGFQDPQKAIGKIIPFEDHATIVGVAADFHQQSLHEAIGPLLISNGTAGANRISLSLQPSHGDASAWPATIAQIEKAFKSTYPKDEFTYTFVDETIAKFYTSEQNTVRLLKWATGLVIFISCLGLLGLAIYITNQRTKEIGIRKVIGATVTQIVLLLSRDLIKLVGLAIVIAMPIAWWGSNKWLQNFAYKTTLSWWLFVSGGALLLLVALAVLGLRTARSARANPVESLRSE